MLSLTTTQRERAVCALLCRKVSHLTQTEVEGVRPANELLHRAAAHGHPGRQRYSGGKREEQTYFHIDLGELRKYFGQILVVDCWTVERSTKTCSVSFIVSM